MVRGFLWLWCWFSVDGGWGSGDGGWGSGDGGWGSVDGGGVVLMGVGVVSLNQTSSLHTSQMGLMCM